MWSLGQIRWFFLVQHWPQFLWVLFYFHFLSSCSYDRWEQYIYKVNLFISRMLHVASPLNHCSCIYLHLSHVLLLYTFQRKAGVCSLVSGMESTACCCSSAWAAADDNHLLRCGHTFTVSDSPWKSCLWWRQTTGSPSFLVQSTPWQRRSICWAENKANFPLTYW